MDDDDDRDDLYARFDGGENNGRTSQSQGQEVESDANWVPSHSGEGENDDEEVEEEEKEAADEFTSVKKRIRKGKEKVEESLHVENSSNSSHEYEQMDKMELDSDHISNGVNAAHWNAVPDEGTSQSAQRRHKKRKRELDNIDGKLETTKRCGENSLYTNHITFQVYDLHESNSVANACQAKTPVKKQRRARKEKQVHRLDEESEDARWARSLRGPQLRLMQALKDLGTERVDTIKEESLYNCLTPAALRVIGIILVEHAKEQLSLLGSEAAVDGEERAQSGNLSSAEEEETAGTGRRVDATDDMKTDMKDNKKSSNS